MSDQLDSFKAMVQQGDFLVLDTETTDLNNGEICQIAIIDAAGTPLLNTFVKTRYSIPPAATRVHHITDTDVATAPTWGQLTDQIKSILTGRNLIVYNAVYDRKMMHQSAEKWELPKVEWKAVCSWRCAMLAFAEVYGDWNRYRHDWRWQSLATAAAYYDIPVIDAHSALGDCQMTLAVVQAMVGSPLQPAAHE